MRKRFPLSVHLEYEDALEAKKVKKTETPNGEYQIRKFKDGFRLVERLTTSEAKVIANARRPKKRKGSIYVAG